MSALSRIWQVAVCEWFNAIRSRRALVVLVLYVATSFMAMYGTVSALGKMEGELAKVLQLPPSEKSGAVTAALWKSKHFQGIVRHAVRDTRVYDDLVGRHPAELIYALLAFALVPMLVVLESGNRISDDLHSGAVRYMITRVTRLEWSLGKFAGQALMILPSLLLGALAAWAVAVMKLTVEDSASLVVPMLGWALKAWVLGFAYLGAAMGVSHFTLSGAKATVFGVVTLVAFSALPKLFDFFASRGGVFAVLPHFNALFPSWAEGGLWRSSFAPVATSAAWLVALGLLYLMAGCMRFCGRDAR